MNALETKPAANINRQRAHIEVVRNRPGQQTEVGPARDPERIMVRNGAVLERWERVCEHYYEEVIGGARR